MEQESQEASVSNEEKPYTDITEKPKSKKAIGIVIALVAVLAIVAVCIAVYLYDQDQKERYALEHRTYQVMFTPNMEGYSPNDSTPIPLRIEGNDFEGNGVSENLAFVSNGATPIDLMRGEYTLIISSSPVLSDGTIFDVSGCTVSISIGGDSDSEQASVIVEQAPMPIPALDVTDEELNATKEGLLAVGMSVSDVNEHIKKAQERRQAAVEQKAAEEEAAKRAEAKSSFEQRFSALDGYVENDARSGGTMMEMAELSYDYFKKLDALMSDVCNYLYETLPVDQANSLRSSQASWVAERDDVQKMAAASLGMASGNSISIEYNLAGTDMMEKRIPELISKIL